MSKKTIPDMKEIFRQAAEIAQQVPESMQAAAFNRALDMLTEQTASRAHEPERVARGTGEQSRKPPAEKSSTPSSSIDALLASIDTTQHPGVASATKVLDRALMVLQIALRDHQVDGLTPPEIARVLTEKFRLGTSVPAVNMALAPASTLVNRVARGRAYEYRIMGPGEKYLTSVGSGGNTGKGPASAPPARRRKPKAKEQSGSESAPQAQPSRAKGNANRPGPKELLEKLIAENFFDAPRDIAQTIGHIQERHARTYKATDLSPALTRLRREDKLDRSKNEKGIYQYVVHKA